MRVEIWCKQNCLHDKEALKVWSGDLPIIPRIGEYIIIFDGWCSERIEDIHHFIYEEEPYVMLEIRADTTGEYRDKIRKESE